MLGIGSTCLADQVCNGVGAHQNLRGGAAALADGQRQQLLGDDAAQHGGQLAADLVLRAGRADVDDAVDRLRRAMVCSVLMTRCPVSAAVTAAEIVS